MKKVIMSKYKTSQSPSTPSPPPPQQRQHFRILGETSKEYKRFNAWGKVISIKIKPVEEDEDPVTHLKRALESVIEYVKRDVDPTDMLGINIRNTENIMDKDMGISMRPCSEMNIDVLWAVMFKVIQSNAKFSSSDALSVSVDCVKMINGDGRSLNARGHALNTLSHEKRSIVRVKSKKNCLASAIVIAMASLAGDSKYNQLRKGYKPLKARVAKLLRESGVNLENGGGIKELKQFQAYLSDYHLVV
jgi:hypothetical protein